MQNSLKSIFNKTEIKGTILIAKEGVNGTIAGTKNEITVALEKLWCLDFLIDLEPKYSFAYKNPFFRMKIRQKKRDCYNWITRNLTQKDCWRLC